MSGNISVFEEPGLTARPESQRDLKAKAVFFQVNFKYRRYWSQNLVYEDKCCIAQLRFCPFCEDNIEHDERGHPYCLSCGSIFPLPPSTFPKTDEKLEKHHAANMRKFLRKITAEDDDAGPDRLPRMEAKRKTPSKGRPGKSARDK